MKLHQHSVLAAGIALALTGLAHAKPQGADANLGLGLRDLVQTQAPAAQRAGSPAFSQSSLVVRDAAGRVRVKVMLNGKQPLATVRTQAQRLGAVVNAETTRYRQGAFTAYVPVAGVAALGKLAGVRSVVLAVPAVTNVGATTSQGAAVLKTDQLNALGIDGTGITVGVMSDSYNTSTNRIKAPDDVASGDLPGPGNPLGHLSPVVVLVDQPGGTDEGRAMAQIVHDLAPGAKLCFATAYDSEIAFANNIAALADPNGGCKASVIVDDIIYLSEPMFSDGIIAQQVDSVVAAGIPYFASAGNRSATMAYQADFRPIARDAAIAAGQTVDLSAIPAAASAGGFHNFNAGPGAPDVAQTIQVNGNNTLIFQWNDPFDAGGVTTDYDIYAFLPNGTLFASSVDDNHATDEPIEGLTLPTGTYQIVFVRASGSPATPVAQRIRYIDFGSIITSEYFDFNAPGTFGHNSSKGAMGTAAYPWYEPYVTESFTSPGPSYMYFDAAGNRLAEPEIRIKPDIAAIDGVNTTFFSSDSAEDPDTFPNFFGTSAAAPHGAGVAALLLQKGGGPGSLTPQRIREVLQATANSHSLVPNIIEATAAAGAAKVVLTGTGNGDNVSSYSPEAFKITLLAPAGYTLANLTLNVSTANAQRVRLGVPAPGMQFDPRPPTTGFPLTLGTLKNITPGSISFSALSTVAPFSQSLTVAFAAGSFGNKTTVSFGVDRDETGPGSGGNAMELLAGGTISGTVTGPGNVPIPFSATLAPRLSGKGYSPLDGFGLIDALSAVQSLP
jgi:hypothetical protein